MKTVLFGVVLVITSCFYASAQVGIGTTNPNPSAMLDVDGVDKGLLIPRMETSKRLGMTPVNGMMVYDHDLNQFFVYEKGAWVWMGTGDPGWTRSAANSRTVLANSGDNVGIGANPAASAVLDIRSSTRGLLIPRMSQANMTAIASPSTGLMVYNTTANAFYSYNGSAWTMLVASSAGMLKDTDGDTKIEVEKNPDEDIIRFTLAGSEKMTLTGNRLEMPKTESPNLFIGMWAGKANIGAYNTALGDSALRTNSTGQFNTATGYQSLWLNSTGNNNTANGYTSLANNTASFNCAFGSYSLNQNTAGTYNTASGHSALSGNTIGGNNTANGARALSSNSSGSSNTAIGNQALFANTTGYSNVAVGAGALHENSVKSNLVAVGDSSLFSNGMDATDPGHSKNNIAVGSKALFSNTTGSSNVAIGNGALRNAIICRNSVAIGDSALYYSALNITNPSFGYGNENVAIGSKALGKSYNGKMHTAIGYHAMANNRGAYGNVAIGYLAGEYNIAGEGNTAIGSHALQYNKSHQGTAVGYYAMQYHDTTDLDNSSSTAVGYQAMRGSGPLSGITAKWNTAVGCNALRSMISGNGNTCVGSYSLENNGYGNSNVAIGSSASISNIDGNENTALGTAALSGNISGSGNTAAGNSSLYNNNGSSNVAIGQKALFTQVNGYSNVAVGTGALFSTNTRNNLVALGDSALYNNYSNSGTFPDYATKNTAVGSKSLFTNTTGYGNSALGYEALNKNSTGDYNTAMGSGALFNNNTGDKNVAIGVSAMGENATATTLGSNVAIGYLAGGLMTTGTYNVLIGAEAGRNLTSGYSNVWLGYSVGNSGTLVQHNSIAIGESAPVDASNKARIGNTSVTSIGGQVNWTAFSDGRFKKNFRNDVPGLAFIALLQPMTYNFDMAAINNHYYPGGDQPDNNEEAGDIRYSGFIAQDVDAAAKSIGYDFSGVDKSSDALGLRYAEFVVPLVKAVQEQQEIILKLEERIKELEKLVTR